MEAWSLSNLTKTARGGEGSKCAVLPIQTLTKYFSNCRYYFSTMTRRPRLNSSSYRNLSKRPNVCSRKSSNQTSNPPWGGGGEVMILYSPHNYLFVKKLDRTGRHDHPGDNHILVFLKKLLLGNSKVLVPTKKLPTKKKPPPERGR